MSTPKLGLRMGDADQFKYTRSGGLHGPLALVLGDECFPADDWTDFPIVLIRQWITALSSSTFPVHLEFMEGPYEVVLRGPSAEDCRVEAINTGSRSIEVAERLDCTCISRALEEAATVLLLQAERSGGSGDDVDRLRALL